jgi:uncharacterized protein (DUF433 family)
VRKSFCIFQIKVLPLQKKIMATNIDRITINPDICHGKPTIRNMCYPVEMVLDLLASGMSNQEIINDYPSIEEADIIACLIFAAQLTKVKTFNQLIA